MLSRVSQRKTNTVCYHLHVEPKKYSKLVNKIKKKHTHREKTAGYHCGEEKKEGQYRGRVKKKVVMGLY